MNFFLSTDKEVSLIFFLITFSLINVKAYEEYQSQENEDLDKTDLSKIDNEDIIFGGQHNAETTVTETLTTTTTSSSSCKINLLVHCLLNPLDEWAMVLYTLKENVVAISGKQCNTTRDVIRRCVEEDAIDEFQCDQSTILSIAARVTDLLVHRKNSGNLLRSYYVTAYVCSIDGQTLRAKVDDRCLLQEHIGLMTFEAMKEIDEKLMSNRSATLKDRCSFLKQRALMMKSIGNHKCDQHEPRNAGVLMCETLKMAFQKMYVDTFGDGKCDFTCRDDQNDHPREDNVQGSALDGGGQGTSTDNNVMTGQVSRGDANGPVGFLIQLVIVLVYMCLDV